MKNLTLLATFLVLPLLCLSGHASETNKLIGGQNNTAEERPWVVKIHYKGRGHCTGTLIAKQWVLTAGHCFARARAPYDNFAIGGAGDGQFINLIRLPGIEKVFVHPGYGSATVNDLSLVKLKAPITVAANLAPIQMKGLGSISLAEGVPGTITAWGLMSSSGRTPTNLQSITLPVQRTTDLAADAMPEYFLKYPDYLKPNVLVMIKPGTTTCRGDSGAGWTMKSGEKHYLVGVHSAGDYCKSIALGAELTPNLLWIRTRMLFGN